LVVDDNRDVADSLGTLLGFLGHRVRVVYGGEAALRAALADPPDGAFLDINMPGLDGYAVARRLKEDPTTRAVKLIAFTAHREEPHASRIREAGFDEHLVKGQSPTELQRVLRMFEQIKELAQTTEQLARRNAELAGETKELLHEARTEFKEARTEIREVKEEFQEVKEELKEVKEELKEVKEELKETRQSLGGEPVE